MQVDPNADNIGRKGGPQPGAAAMQFGHFGRFQLSLPVAEGLLALVPEVGAGTTLFLFAAPTHRSSR
jgi:hypothetical protein